MFGVHICHSGAQSVSRLSTGVRSTERCAHGDGTARRVCGCDHDYDLGRIGEQDAALGRTSHVRRVACEPGGCWLRAEVALGAAAGRMQDDGAAVDERDGDGVGEDEEPLGDQEDGGIGVSPAVGAVRGPRRMPISTAWPGPSVRPRSTCTRNRAKP